MMIEKRMGRAKHLAHVQYREVHKKFWPGKGRDYLRNIGVGDSIILKQT